MNEICVFCRKKTSTNPNKVQNHTHPFHPVVKPGLKKQEMNENHTNHTPDHTNQQEIKTFPPDHAKPGFF